MPTESEQVCHCYRGHQMDHELLYRIPAAPGCPIEEVPPLHNVEHEIEMNMDERGGGRLAREHRT